MEGKARYGRVLLKLSGEALEGDQGHGICPQTLANIAGEVVEVCRMGVQVALVIGGGNIFRGLKGSTSGMNRGTADAMGMLATAINALAFEDALLRKGHAARVYSALPLGGAARVYSRREALASLESGEVVVLAGGTGNPYFTTDTAAALRALELEADALLKATRVDGIYDRDPLADPGARRFAHLTYDEVLQRKLKVMDLTAVTLCRENHLPLLVFDLTAGGNIMRVIRGEDVGSRVTDAPSDRTGPDPKFL